MRRLALVGVVLTVMASLAIGGAALAAPGSGSVRAHSLPALSPAQIKSAMAQGHIKNARIITAGSGWTYYDHDPFAAAVSNLFCELITFNSGGTFTGDKGDLGTFSGNVRFTTVTGTGPLARLNIFGPLLFKGKFVPIDSGFFGELTSGGIPMETAVLLPGDDPLGEGPC